MPLSVKYEYKDDMFHLGAGGQGRIEFRQRLNKLGEQGWQVVSIIPKGPAVFWILFMREIILEEQ